MTDVQPALDGYFVALFDSKKKDALETVFIVRPDIGRMTPVHFADIVSILLRHELRDDDSAEEDTDA